MYLFLKSAHGLINGIKAPPFLLYANYIQILHPHIFEFLEYLHQNFVNFSILGNPFHLTLDVAKYLKQLGCTNYQMSLDGLRDTHDLIRKPGSFDETIKKIAVLREAGVHSGIMTTVSRTNITELPNLVDVVVKSEVDNFAFARYCPNPDDFDLMPSPEEYRDFLEKMWQKYIQYAECSTRFALKDHLWKLFLYEKGLFKIDDIQNEDNLILDGCHCGVSHITVLADGQIYACRRSITPVGNVFSDSLYDVFLGEKMNEYRKYDSFEECSKCELKCFCRGCPSVAKCVTGNFYAKDPQCWKKFD